MTQSHKPAIWTEFVHADVLACTLQRPEMPINLNPKTENPTEKQYRYQVQNAMLDMVHPTYPHAFLDWKNPITCWIWLMGKTGPDYVEHPDDKTVWVELSREQLTLLNEATDCYMTYFDIGQPEADFVKFRKVEDLNDYIGEPLADMNDNPDKRQILNIQIHTTETAWQDEVPKTLPQRVVDLIKTAFAEEIDSGAIDLLADYRLEEYQNRKPK